MPTQLVPIDAAAVSDCLDAIPEEEILDLVVEAFDALADPTRAKILYLLLRRPLCVRDLAINIGISESAVSHQLRLLRLRRLVKASRRGHAIEYHLDDHHVAALFKEAEFHADHIRSGMPDHPYPSS
jgi:DNA-binding transcriptional ArsR family regulator